MRRSRLEHCSATAPGASKISVLAVGSGMRTRHTLRVVDAFSTGLKFRAFIQEESRLETGDLAGATLRNNTGAAC